jgi:hypothetical protein
MSSATKASHQLPLANLIYLAAPIALAWQTSDLRVAGLIVLPVLVLSWAQDWISCTIAADYYDGRLAAFDIVTAANYVALARALELHVSSTWRLSQFVFVHWATVFAIYITWNLRLMRDSDGTTRRMMRRFALAEILPLGVCGVLIVLSGEGDTIRTPAELALVALLMAMHAALLWYWRRQSRPSREEDLAR